MSISLSEIVDCLTSSKKLNQFNFKFDESNPTYVGIRKSKELVLKIFSENDGLVVCPTKQVYHPYAYVVSNHLNESGNFSRINYR